jgi:hypothetical protein
LIPDVIFAERAAQAADGFLAGRGPDDELQK